MTKIKNNNKGYLFTALLFFSSQIIFAQTTISTTSVITMDLQEEESVMGMIFSRASPSLAAEVSGRVIEVLADIGDEVDKGQVLAKIDPEKYGVHISAIDGNDYFVGNQDREFYFLASISYSSPILYDLTLMKTMRKCLR